MPTKCNAFKIVPQADIDFYALKHCGYNPASAVCCALELCILVCRAFVS